MTDAFWALTASTPVGLSGLRLWGFGKAGGDTGGVLGQGPKVQSGHPPVLNYHPPRNKTVTGLGGAGNDWAKGRVVQAQVTGR